MRMIRAHYSSFVCPDQVPPMHHALWCDLDSVRESDLAVYPTLRETYRAVFLRLSFDGIENAVSFAIGEAIAIFAEKCTGAWPFAGRVLFAFGDIASRTTDAAASAA